MAAVAAIAITGGLIVGGFGRQPTPAEGTPAPEVTLLSFEGEPVSLSEFRGAPVVLNFFASWCPTCVAEMPDFQSVHTRFADGDVTFIGVAVQDDPALAQALVAHTGVTYPTFQDPRGTVYRAFGGFAMPTTVFIDAAGNVVSTHAGALFASDLEQRISSMLLDS